MRTLNTALGLFVTIVVDGFVVEDVLQLLVSHAATCIGNGHFDIVGRLLGADGDTIALSSKLAGIVCQSVQHEKGQHTVGLDSSIGGANVEGDALHGEAMTTTAHQVEERLQRKAFDVEVEFALSQLNPLSQQVVLLVDIVGQLADIV